MNVSSRRVAVAALATLMATATHAYADDDVRRYAVIVAHGEDLAGNAPDLQYADDDAARYFELYQHIADDVRLFSVLDRDTQRLHPEAAAAADVPSRDRVLAGLDAVFEAARADTQQGQRVEFTFVLAGHGNIGPGGEGYISLLDAPFTRSDLYQHVLAKSPATVNHVIIDACNSFFLVNRRGGEDAVGPGRDDAVRAFLKREDLARYPNTGVVLSTSSEAESHEWSAYRAGVFSHMVRSAMAGAADVNGDGRIEYSELEAFVAAANARVDDPRARVEIFARPPAIDESRPLVDLRHARFEHWLAIPRGDPLRVYLEDARGIRYLDAHASGEHDLLVALVAQPHYFVRTSDGQHKARVRLSQAGRLTFDRARLRPVEIAARSAVADAFRVWLFSEPYGPSFYQGFVAARERRPIRFDAASWRPRAAPLPDCARRAAGIARSRGLGPGDDAELDRLFRATRSGLPAEELTHTCEQVLSFAETTRVDADTVRRQLAALNERARTDRRLRTRLHAASDELVDLLRAGRYEAAAQLLARAARE
jgi:hypothetical protein